MKKHKLRLSDMSKQEKKPLVHLENDDLMPLPSPLSDASKDHNWMPLSTQVRRSMNARWMTPAL